MPAFLSQAVLLSSVIGIITNKVGREQSKKTAQLGVSLMRLSPKPECKTFVHFMMRLFRTVILSGAKNLMPRPFVALRVTTLVCQSHATWFRGSLARPLRLGVVVQFDSLFGLENVGVRFIGPGKGLDQSSP